MKINKSQEIAMWVLGLLWCGVFAFDFFLRGHEEFDFYAVLVIPTFLIIFSLRSRN